jgi:hypothetical protein
MRKDILIKFAIFAFGATVGFLAGKKYYEDFYADLAQDEIDSVKEAFSKYPVKVEEDRSSEHEEDRCRTAPNPLNRSSLDGNPYEQAKQNYNLIRLDRSLKRSAEVKSESDVKSEPNVKKVTVTVSEPDPDVPYIISDVEFSEEYDHHEKLTLLYYRLDDVLCDDTDDVVEDAEEVIGLEALDALDRETTVWVRNETLGMDYEVIGLNKSYAEDVHGIVTDMPKSIRRKKERTEDEE